MACGYCHSGRKRACVLQSKKQNPYISGKDGAAREVSRVLPVCFYWKISKYDKGIYDEADVAVFVRAGSITPEEYELITGEPYENEA